MSKDWEGVQNENLPKELEDQITKLGLDFRLMTQFTSFVAVEEKVRTQGGQGVKVEVPSENSRRRENLNNSKINESPTVPPPPKPRPNAAIYIGKMNKNSVGSPSG